jgi:hypothetical protein
MLLILVYAWVLGLSSVSKGAILIVMGPVIVLAWLDKRKIMFIVAFFATLIGISVAEGVRAYVYIVTENKTGADTSLNLITLLTNVITETDSKMWNFDFLPLSISQILSRVEGFNNLVMAQYYNPDHVVGAWGFILRMIWRNLSIFNVDLHSIQWQGHVLPEGFYNGGALLSNAVIIGNAGLWWVILSALVTAIMLIILEKSCNRISRKYELFESIRSPIIIYMSLLFFTETGGSETFIFPLLFLFITSWLPPIVGRNKLTKSPEKDYVSTTI